MARRFQHPDGSVERIEFRPDEFARLCGVETGDIERWGTLVPREMGTDGRPAYIVRDEATMATLRRRIAVLRTRMSEQAVAAIEKQGLLDAYAALAADCPPGLTAHVYRSYVVLLTMQERFGVMLDAAGLAERANLREMSPEGSMEPSEELARAHLMLLQHSGKLLRRGEDRWIFGHVPAFLRGER